jgi:hypothetical protein
MASEKLIKTFNDLATECTAASADDLLVNRDWGTINFEGCRPELQRTFDMLNELKILPVVLMPEPSLQTIIGHATPVRDTIKQIKAFSIEGQGNPAGARDGLVTQLKQQSDAFFTVAHAFIPYLAYRKGDVQKNINELTKSVTGANKLLEDTIGEIAEKKTTIDGIITAARDASASVGVAHFTADFGNEATENNNEGKRWLRATVAAGCITILASVGMMFVPMANDASKAQIIQLFTSKVLLLALLFTATIWCGRLYKATKHLETLNRHRSNSLKTFQAFVKAASDDASRNAVLMETTRSIFTIAPSGYLDSTDVSSDSSVKIIEVVKNATHTAAAAK